MARQQELEAIVEAYAERRIDRRELLARAAALGVAGTAAAALAERAGAAPARATAGGTLRYGWNQKIDAFDPQRESSNGSIWSVMQIYDQLVQIDKQTKGVVPGLARSWKTSPNGLVWTFELRDAAFHDGTPVRASDVVFSLKRGAEPESPIGFIYAPIRKVEALGEKTVRLTLKNPLGDALLAVLSTFPSSIVSQAYFTKAGKDEFGQQPLGSGPFKFQQLRRGDHLTLAANDRWWGGRPKLDGVRFIYVTDDNTRMLKLEAGELDVAENVPYNQVDEIARRKGVHVEVVPVFAVVTVWLNNAKKPLGDMKVRQALNYAVDRRGIVKTVLAGKARPANSVIAPFLKHYDPSVKPYPYDPAKAKKLLQASSAPGGFTLDLIVEAGNVALQQIANILKAEWGQIGVTVNLENVDYGQAGTRFRNFDYMGYLHDALTSDMWDEIELAGAVVDYASSLGIRSFWTNYKNAEATRIVRATTKTDDRATLTRLYHRLQRVTLQDPGSVPIYFPTFRTAYRQNVHGFHTLKTGWWNLEDVSLG